MNKLVKSSNKKMISGVCSGLSSSIGIDVSIVRLLFVFATIFGVGSPIIVYIILALVLPAEYT